MNKRVKAVYKLLTKNPKVKAFGFNNKELKGLAAKIAGNLKSEEDASDEDVKYEVSNVIQNQSGFIPITISNIQQSSCFVRWNNNGIIVT